MKTAEDCSINELRVFQVIFCIASFILGILGIKTMPVGALFIVFFSIPLILLAVSYNRIIKRKQSQTSSTNISYTGSTDKIGAQHRAKQLNDSYQLIKSTVNANVFFARLAFCFDCLLGLMTYDKSIFIGATPEEQYKLLYDNIENYVNDFIDRSYKTEMDKAKLLKTEKGKQNRMKKYFYEMYQAFENAHSYWEGNNIGPHYTDILYTDTNIAKLHLLEKNCPYVIDKTTYITID